MKRLRSALVAATIIAGLAGYAAAQNPYYEGGDYRYDHDYRYDNFRVGVHVASENGFHDGAETAREDMWKGKPFDPLPRGHYGHADHGYRHEFGSKDEYRERYTDAYHQAYVSTFRQYRYR